MSQDDGHFFTVSYASLTGTFRWTFSRIVPHTFQLSCHSWIQLSIEFLKVQPNYDRALPACGLSSFITLPASVAS